jgi:hypothetical protein
VKQNLPPFPKKLLVHSDAKLEQRRAALEGWLSAAIRCFLSLATARGASPRSTSTRAQLVTEACVFGVRLQRVRSHAEDPRRVVPGHGGGPAAATLSTLARLALTLVRSHQITEKQENSALDWKSLSDKIAGEIYAAEQARNVPAERSSEDAPDDYPST